MRISQHNVAAMAVLLAVTSGVCAAGRAAEPLADTDGTKPLQDIKAYCLDFNWGGRRQFANPGTWKDADPAAHVAWYKAIGANVIQTFCVSSGGYAWYKGGPVPEQPGLKHDFLREVVRLGRAEGMMVMGYFTIGANTRWGKQNPTLSYGTPSTYHIPYTDAYLEYLEAAVSHAVATTGIDGFMIDWVWQPRRQSTRGKWIDAEKKLYAQLMGEPFPGEDKLTREQDLAYSRKAIDRCWQTVRKAAKAANPNAIIWLTSNNMNHPHVVDSNMYRQVDWLMGEAGNMAHIKAARGIVGEHTRLITCLANWNGQDAAQVVPAALEVGVGLYGFCKPRTGGGLIPLEPIFTRQVSELSGDDRNIAVLARAYHGKSVHAVWRDGAFVEPDSPPPFGIAFRRRGRGWQDTAKLSHDKASATVTVRTPYQSGRAQLTRIGETWPATLTIELTRKPRGDNAQVFRMANGKVGLSTSLDGQGTVIFGTMTTEQQLGRPWGEAFAVGDKPATPTELKPRIVQAQETTRIVVPAVMTAGNPKVLTFEWATSPDAPVR